MPKLENWSITAGTQNPFRAPEQYAPHLQGKVEGDERFPDGATITSTRIVLIEEVDGEMIATTRSGTKYKLGNIDLGYAERYPQARERLIAAYAKYKEGRKG